MVATLGQLYNTGEKPTVMLYTNCMAINVISVQYNGGLLPDIILLTICHYIGEPFETMKSFCPYSQCSHLNIFTIFPLRVDAQVQMRSDFSYTPP